MVLASLSLAVAALYLLSPIAFAAPNPNAGTIVNLRIEGRSHTIFEGPVFTRGHNVTTASAGTIHCDGTNHGINPEPGPTATTALDDAASIHGFTWDGTPFTGFDDIFVTSIGGDTQTTTEFWGILLAFEFTPVGGCQQRVKLGDHLLWAFDAFSKAHFLKLDGPHTARRNKSITLTVTDGATGSPIAGATANGQTSDENGHIVVTFDDVGLKGVKAEKPDSIRSNRLDIVVLP
ncbi:hypothetical protein BDZ94DRAFT_1257897 [Collybia nuda]|uniref:Uncharacterized protein n=1 Tax=Collybia nuda TaxID=64659 RepID=A0A9P6CFC9_9AGAR|nr:hypothetical protein BDZ94DRAFT_1257897 [Collybia nuda]